jgi:hypothetical protein
MLTRRIHIEGMGGGDLLVTGGTGLGGGDPLWSWRGSAERGLGHGSSAGTGRERGFGPDWRGV